MTERTQMKEERWRTAGWQLDREDFVQHYLVSGPKIEPFSSTARDTNQLRYEGYLRSVVAEHEAVRNAAEIRTDENSRLGMPWRFQGGTDCAFVNLSEFYPTMQRVRFDAVTVLYVPHAVRVRAVLWGYTAADLYLNGERVASLEEPVYKPIQRRETGLNLREGRNTVYLACETLGVRDTRSTVGLQLTDAPEELRVALPEERRTEETAAALSFLEEAQLEADRIRFARPAPAGTAWARIHHNPDYTQARKPLQWQSAEGKTEIPLSAGDAYIAVETEAGGERIRRTFERTEQIRPQYVKPTPSREENLKIILKRIAEVESLDRGEFGFPIANMLARKALGMQHERDAEWMKDMLALIDRRVDCADFLVCGLIRYLKNYEVDEETGKQIRRTLTGWRYWMDQDGFDGMCFWSENHCLMFYTSAMLAGEMYPEDEFPLAGRRGRELSEWGRSRVLDWLQDVETWGFEEFHSTVYTCVTFAALLNVIDYAEPEISRRAADVTDKMLRSMADHTFRGGIIAPQGRVYRGALYPFRAGAMALMNLADPEQPYDYGEGWLGFYATSGYRFPEDLKERMERTASLDYVTGNARIRLEKQEDWCLTSVQIPREPFVRWENETRKPGADASSHAFVKSYNECFHGTTCFQPGCYGYQQHLWYAALDGEAAVFIQHPGSASEGGDMRPGYWHGNGVFPAMRQEGAVLGMIWRIPEEHPFHYIHLYCPECRFDEARREGSWLLLRKNNGYIGLWASAAFEPWTGMNTGCEQRIWGRETACLCVCAGRETENLEAFAEKCREMRPVYDPETGELRAGAYRLIYQAGKDETQYL